MCSHSGQPDLSASTSTEPEAPHPSNRHSLLQVSPESLRPTDLSLQLKHEPEHAVSGRVLRPEVQLHHVDLLDLRRHVPVEVGPPPHHVVVLAGDDGALERLHEGGVRVPALGTPRRAGGKWRGRWGGGGGGCHPWCHTLRLLHRSSKLIMFPNNEWHNRGCQFTYVLWPTSNCIIGLNIWHSDLKMKMKLFGYTSSWYCGIPRQMIQIMRHKGRNKNIHNLNRYTQKIIANNQQHTL